MTRPGRDFIFDRPPRIGPQGHTGPPCLGHGPAGSALGPLARTRHPFGGEEGSLSLGPCQLRSPASGSGDALLGQPLSRASGLRRALQLALARPSGPPRLGGSAEHAVASRVLLLGSPRLRVRAQPPPTGHSGGPAGPPLLAVASAALPS